MYYAKIWLVGKKDFEPNENNLSLTMIRGQIAHLVPFIS